MRAPASVGQRLEEVDTPALIVDLDAFEKNLFTLANAVKGHDVRVRAHAKTHKCPEIAKRQLSAGAIGVCCQKVSEAEAMVEGGIEDVLVSNEVVGAPKLGRLAALATRARLGVCVDNRDNLRQLEASGAKLDVYVELDIGMRRCGIAPGEPALALAREIARSGPCASQDCRPITAAPSMCGPWLNAVRRSRPPAIRLFLQKPCSRKRKFLSHRHWRRQRQLHVRGGVRRVERDPARFLCLHGRRLRAQRMGRAAAALRALRYSCSPR